MSATLVWAALAAALVAAAGCGDDGKPKLYEACDATTACSDPLACLDQACTRGCVVEVVSSGDPLVVGQCLEATECESELLGCCLLNLVESGNDHRGQGNCVIAAPPAGV